MDTETKQKMEQRSHAVLEHLRTELAGVRTGRASLILFESLQINSYGAVMPLKQLASLSTPEARLVVIQPWDIHLIPEIEKAILSSSLGLTPSNDGRVIRIGIPQLTEEKRKDLVKVVKKQGEDSKVSIRNIRREVNDELKALQKTGDLSEDMIRKSQDEAQKITDQAISKVDHMVQEKEADILKV
jgi:ribosome recycling factor